MRTNRNNKLYGAIAICLVGFAFQIFLQFLMRPYTTDGIHFQNYSSERLMQTVPIEDLQNAPLQTIWNIHIQPPALDTIRMILVHLWPSPHPSTAINHVDRLLYILWALIYGLVGAVVFLWCLELTNAKIATLASIVILLHPGSIYFATLLDTTLLSSLLILCMYYLLWKIKNNQKVSVPILAMLIAGLFFTRSIFQWPFLILFALSLLAIGMPKKDVFLFLAISGLVIGAYVVKQYAKFGTTSTSSFTGLNLVRSVGLHDFLDYRDSPAASIPRENQNAALPDVLAKKFKINGYPNYNNLNYLAYNKQLIKKYENYLETLPFGNLARSYTENLILYLWPSSRYAPDTTNVIVAHLPWRNFLDDIFSFPILVILLLLATIIWWKYTTPKDALVVSGFILPGLFIFAISILFEKGENMRFKYFLEPVFWVFIVSQIHVAATNIPRKKQRHV